MNIKTTLLFGLLVLVLPTLALAQDDAPKQTVFTNVMIFDGVNDGRTAGNILVEGNLIKQVSAEAINAPGATVIAFPLLHSGGNAGWSGCLRSDGHGREGACVHDAVSGPGIYHGA
jgi:hypothetical protein